MRVLSIKEPFASLIKEKIKIIETRSWKTKYRGELYIHASLKKINLKDDRIRSLLKYIPDKEMQYGKIICKCELVDCIYMDENYIKSIKRDEQEYLCGRYEVGRYAWILKVVEVLKEPIVAKGRLGIWKYNPKKRIVFASNNKNKLKEIKAIFKDFDILSLNDVNCNLDIIEDGKTFYDNALKKASTIYNFIKIPVIADDSGLCIEVLNNWPGVMTKRIISGTDKERNLEIIKRLEKESNKKARVVCSLVYYDGENIIESTKEIRGKIVKPRGEYGFGFDPIFEMDNKKTLAELTEDEKNSCSARYLACESILYKLKNNISIND